MKERRESILWPLRHVPSPKDGNIIQLTDEGISEYIEFPEDTIFMESMAINNSFAKGIAYVPAQRMMGENGDHKETHVYSIQPGQAEAKHLFGPIATEEGTSVTIFGSALSSTGILYLCAFNQNAILAFDVTNTSHPGETAYPMFTVSDVPAPNDVCVDPSNETVLFVAGGTYRRLGCGVVFSNPAFGKVYRIQLIKDKDGKQDAKISIFGRGMSSLSGIGATEDKVWVAQLYDMVTINKDKRRKRVQVWKGDDASGKVWLADNVDVFDKGIIVCPAYSTTSKFTANYLLAKRNVLSIFVFILEVLSCCALRQTSLREALEDPEILLSFSNTYIKEGEYPCPIKLIFLKEDGSTAYHFEVDLVETRRDHEPRVIKDPKSGAVLGRRHHFNDQVTHASGLQNEDGSASYVACISFEQPRILLLEDRQFRKAMAGKTAPSNKRFSIISWFNSLGQRTFTGRRDAAGNLVSRDGNNGCILVEVVKYKASLILLKNTNFVTMAVIHQIGHVPSPGDDDIIRLTDEGISEYIEFPEDTIFMESIAQNHAFAKDFAYVPVQRVLPDGKETHIYEIHAGYADAKHVCGPLATRDAKIQVTVFGSALSSDGLLYLCVFNHNAILGFDLSNVPKPGETAISCLEINDVPAPNDVCIDPIDECVLYVAGGTYSRLCCQLQFSNATFGKIYRIRLSKDKQSAQLSVFSRGFASLAGIEVIGNDVWLAQLFNMFTVDTNTRDRVEVWKGNDGSGQVWLADNIDVFDEDYLICPAYATASESSVNYVLSQRRLIGVAVFLAQIFTCCIEGENFQQAIKDPEVLLTLSNTYIREGEPPRPIKLIFLRRDDSAAYHFEVDLVQARQEHEPREIRATKSGEILGKRDYFNDQVTHATRLQKEDGSGFIVCLSFEQPRILLLKEQAFRDAMK